MKLISNKVGQAEVARAIHLASHGAVHLRALMDAARRSAAGIVALAAKGRSACASSIVQPNRWRGHPFIAA
jgi:hypothetical protein